jgi:hypothetical protein
MNDISPVVFSPDTTAWVNPLTIHEDASVSRHQQIGDQRASDISQSDASPDASTRGSDAAREFENERSEEEAREIEELRRRDREVHQHENAHKAAGGRYAIGGPTYEYRLGPDGRRYAISGEVQ